VKKGFRREAGCCKGGKAGGVGVNGGVGQRVGWFIRSENTGKGRKKGGYVGFLRLGRQAAEKNPTEGTIFQRVTKPRDGKQEKGDPSEEK